LSPRGDGTDDTQCGFCHDRSTTEQISTLQQIFEKSWEHAKDAYTCFVDLGKVYGGVPREKLWGVLWEVGVRQGRIKVVWGPWLKLRRGPLYMYKTVVNREKNK